MFLISFLLAITGSARITNVHVDLWYAGTLPTGMPVVTCADMAICQAAGNCPKALMSWDIPHFDYGVCATAIRNNHNKFYCESPGVLRWVKHTDSTCAQETGTVGGMLVHYGECVTGDLNPVSFVFTWQGACMPSTGSTPAPVPSPTPAPISLPSPTPKPTAAKTPKPTKSRTPRPAPTLRPTEGSVPSGNPSSGGAGTSGNCASYGRMKNCDRALQCQWVSGACVVKAGTAPFVDLAAFRASCAGEDSAGCAECNGKFKTRSGACNPKKKIKCAKLGQTYCLRTPGCKFSSGKNRCKGKSSI